MQANLARWQYMKIDVITIFPSCYQGLDCSIIAKAMEKGLIDLNIYDIRDYADNKHKKVDDYPYGGGAGMVMMCQPLCDAITAADPEHKALRILLSPRGKVLGQELAEQLASRDYIMLVNGAYEGVDQRVIDNSIDMELSIGDYILTSGDLASMVTINAISRYVDGVLGSSQSTKEESFSNGMLEYPQYTRPEVYNNMSVPKVLLSGNHSQIAEWRNQESKKLTKKVRPDLLEE